MRVRVNGNGVEVPEGASARDALLAVGVSVEAVAVAVAVNRTVVPRSRLPTHRLAEGDEIEIVRAVGGG
jgi:sulfur carrier protein